MCDTNTGWRCAAAGGARLWIGGINAHKVRGAAAGREAALGEGLGAQVHVRHARAVVAHRRAVHPRHRVAEEARLRGQSWQCGCPPLVCSAGAARRRRPSGAARTCGVRPGWYLTPCGGGAQLRTCLYPRLQQAARWARPAPQHSTRAPRKAPAHSDEAQPDSRAPGRACFVAASEGRRPKRLRRAATRTVPPSPPPPSIASGDGRGKRSSALLSAGSPATRTPGGRPGAHAAALGPLHVCHPQVRPPQPHCLTVSRARALLVF